jgi:hypothetical protein
MRGIGICPQLPGHCSTETPLVGDELSPEKSFGIHNYHCSVSQDVFWLDSRHP